MENQKTQQSSEGEIFEASRTVEAFLFASTGWVSETQLTALIPCGMDLKPVMSMLVDFYQDRGPDLLHSGAGWRFSCTRILEENPPPKAFVEKTLSPSAIDVLAVIAFEQPIPAYRIDEKLGRKNSRAIIRRLVAAGWVVEGMRLQEPNSPIGWVTSEAFLRHFGWANIEQLPMPEEIDEMQTYGIRGDESEVTAFQRQVEEIAAQGLSLPRIDDAEED